MSDFWTVRRLRKRKQRTSLTLAIREQQASLAKLNKRLDERAARLQEAIERGARLGTIEGRRRGRRT